MKTNILLDTIIPLGSAFLILAGLLSAFIYVLIKQDEQDDKHSVYIITCEGRRIEAVKYTTGTNRIFYTTADGRTGIVGGVYTVEEVTPMPAKNVEK
jgi:hypothetical protein